MEPQYNWTDIMVDIETTGTNPDRNGIIQIAAVKFNRHTQEVCHEFFDECLDLPLYRFWNEGTRQWWHGPKNKAVLESICARQQPWHEVLTRFASWCYPAHHLTFWSKPTTFDFMFLSSYFSDLDIANPFHYRSANDLNSFLRGKYFPNPVPDLSLDMDGPAHNAIFDVLYQIKLLFAHMNNNPENQIAADNQGQEG